VAEEETVGALFPLETVWCAPPGLGTADCGLICRADDGLDYAIKDKSTDVAVPHSEWFCTHLAELVNIAAPPCKFVKVTDGTLAMGSRWEGGVIDRNTWTMRLGVDIKLPDLAPVLSRIYAFDHFIYNEDRHTGNLLVREQRNSGVVILAFDYSRAWLTRFPAARATLRADPKYAESATGDNADTRDLCRFRRVREAHGEDQTSKAQRH
jgi:hypothetical protein